MLGFKEKFYLGTLITETISTNYTYVKNINSYEKSLTPFSFSDCDLIKTLNDFDIINIPEKDKGFDDLDLNRFLNIQDDKLSIKEII